MSESTLKPFTGKLDDNTDKKQQPALKPFTGALDGEDKGFLGQAKDHAVSFFGKGAVGVGETAVGLSNMMSDGATGKILSEKLGYDPKAAKNVMTGWQSEQYQQQLKDSANIGNRKIEEGDDFATKVGKKFDNAVDITKNAINNPSLITNTVAESLPSMFLGGVLGRASGIAKPVVAGAVGEGAVMAGSQAEQIRQETVDGRLTADQSLASVGTGALGGLFGYAGGRLAQKMGLSDVDTAMQTGRLTTQQVGEEIAKTPMRAIPTAVIKGAISEGFLEELPQSVSEQILQNLALDKPWHDGVENAAVMGTLAGMAMGGTVSGVGKTGDWWNSRSNTGPQDNQQQSGSPNLPSAPSQFGSNPDSALTGEYIPRGNVPQGDNQGRTAFVYDQPSMEADNLLNNNYKGDTGFDTSGNFGPSNNPDSPLSPSGGNYFDDPASQSQPQLPSERLGINPNDGPMSSAAALAVDSGASPIAQLGYTPEQQTQEQSNTPISDAVPSSYQSLLGSQNDRQPFDARFEDAKVQQGNAQADNAGKSISQQYDANAADAMGGGIETDRAKTTTAQTVQPILGQDGKNKWFGTQDKAQAFIDKKNLGNDYRVVQDGKRFEIQPKSQDNQTQNVDTLPKTESSNQDDVPNPYNENKLRAQVRDLSLQASKEAQANNAEDSKYIANLGNTASARSNEKVKQQLPDLYKRAEELAKTAEITSAGRRGNTHFSSLSFKGDSSFVSGDAWPKRPTKDEVLQQAIWHLSQDDKNGTPKNVQSALQLTELEKQFKNEKSVAKKAQIRKQITELQNGLTEQAQSSVSLNQPQKTTVENLSGEFKKIEESTTRINAVRQRIREANPEIFTAENDRVRETHGLTNARVTMMADEIETSGSYELSDREYEKIYNNPNFKIDYNPKTYTGTVTAIKDPHTGEWLGGNDSIDQAPSSNPQQDIQQFINENKAAFATNWQRDGQLKAQARDVIEKKLDTLLPSDISKQEFQAHVDRAMEYANKQHPTIEAQHEAQNTASEHPVNKWQEEMNKALAKADPEHPLFKKLQASAKNGLRSVSDRAVALRQAREIEKKAEAQEQKYQPKKLKAKAEPSKNTLVSDDRAAELRARLKAKLSQLNSGIDPEIMAIGAELAVYHIERGARKFAALAKNIANDLDVSVEKIRPYLRSWYNGARDMMEDMNANIDDMDDPNTVRAELEKLKSNEIEQSQENDDSVSYESNNPESEAAEPVVHVEGKKKEEATGNVVEKSLNKAQAKLESEQYKEMLNGLVSDVQNAIAQAPNVNPPTYEFSVQSGNNVQSMSLAMPMLANGDANAVTAKMVMDSAIKRIPKHTKLENTQSAEASANRFIQELQKTYSDKPTHITFDVKGDGKFTVQNNKDSLSNFLKKVQSNAGFKPIPKKRDLSTPSFNKINALKAMLSDKDEFTELNAYNMAKASGMPIIFGITNQSHPVPLFVVGQFGEVGNEKLYHTILQTKQGYDNQVSTENGGPLGIGSSEKEVKAKANNHLKPENIERVKTAIAKWNKENGGIQDKLKAEYELYLNNKYGLGSVEENTNEQSTGNSDDTAGSAQVSGSGRGDAQPRRTQGDNRVLDARESTDSGTTAEDQPSGRPSIRSTGTNVDDDGRSNSVGDAALGRKNGSTTTDVPARIELDRQLESDAAVKTTAQDFVMTDPISIIGGTPVKRYEKNVAALELLEELLSQGKQATPEQQAILAGYTGWGSFGQELFQGTWDKPVFKKDNGVESAAWKERNLWLRERLGESAWKSAHESTINAHFTDPYTVTAMWSMAEKMGFTGGRVLEPAVGTGNFISLMPTHVKSRSQVTGIDMDMTTAQISKQLFPESNIQNMPYQNSKTPDNFYDLVISNVPFADIKIADRRYNKLNPNVHDYFFLKALDQVRPGGVVMAITSSGTMDKLSEVIRRELAKKAELVTAIRLPSGAFAEYAGTAVVTDIIVLRKRQEPIHDVTNEPWVYVATGQQVAGGKINYNSFYLNHPQNVIGTLGYGSGTTKFGAGMIVNRPNNLKERLEKLSDLVPESVFLDRDASDNLTYYANKTGERNMSLTLQDNQIMFVYGDQMIKAEDKVSFTVKSEKETAARKQSILDAIQLRNDVIALVDAERAGESNVETLRKKALKSYQSYVADHGQLTNSYGLKYMQRLSDAYYYQLAALEGKDGKPAEMLKRSVVRSSKNVENPTVADAFIIARNKTANPTLKQIAEIVQQPEQQVHEELLKSGAIYDLPNGDIAPSDIYLGGNVRMKLVEAQEAFNQGAKNLERNIKALEAVIPADIPNFNIDAKMGASWVTSQDYADYAANLLGLDDSTGISVSFVNERWKVKIADRLLSRIEARTNYGSQYRKFNVVFQAALSNQILTVTGKDSEGNTYVDQEATSELNAAINKVKESFADWLWSSPERTVRLEKEYNTVFNAWATPKYDGSFMTMDGMALSLGHGPFDLREHQRNAIWRAIVNRKSINAHEVGTGKTFTMGGIALESRRYGIAKKPLILAHNANSAAVASEIQMMYPAARILYISELGKDIRKIRLQQIANDDWDLVVMPHSMIDKLTLSEETLRAMAADDIAAIEAEIAEAIEEGEDGVNATFEEVLAMDSETVNKKLGRSKTAKQLAKQRIEILERIQKSAQESSKADAVLFEDLGIDMIMVDEVHEFKKPAFATRMKMKGLNSEVNKSSNQLQLLTRYVRQQNNGGNVHTFTGTPITNTLTEIFHQMRYVMEEDMKEAGVSSWDGWFGNFATEVEDIELTATGAYQLVSRLAGFVNVPELRKMIGRFMDIVFADDMPEMRPRKTQSGKTLTDKELTEKERIELLNGRTEGAKDRPYKKVINVATEMSPLQEAKLAELQKLAKEWEQADGKTKKEWLREGDEHSPLAISTASKKASYDARIGDDNYVGMEGKTEDDPRSKASQVVQNVKEIYDSHPLACQVIFTDTGYNRTAKRSIGQKDAKGNKIYSTVPTFSPVLDIVERLVQQGIPREQIAIVDGGVKAEARKAIADKMNTGEIRVVIGLTKTLGVGVNMQKNLRAMHHLDAPWMPGELEQRNGRGLRQGNQWNTVLEYRYITDKLDGKSWQVLAIKERFINAFMKADENVRTIEGDAAADNGEDNGTDIMSSFSEAAGDPRVLQVVKLKGVIDKLNRKKNQHEKSLGEIQRNIRSAQNKVSSLNNTIEDFEKNKSIETVEDLLKAQSENFNMKVDNKVYDKRQDADAALKGFVDDHVRLGNKDILVGSYKGHDIRASWDAHQPTYTLSMMVAGRTFIANTLRGLETKMRGLASDLEALIKSRLESLKTIESLNQASKQPFSQADKLKKTKDQLESVERDLQENPVAPPMWLRRGAPVDSEVFIKGKSFAVTGHKYTNDGYFVVAEDSKGEVVVPYLEVTDKTGMPIYDEQEFIAPEIEDKTATDEEGKRKLNDYSRDQLKPDQDRKGASPFNTIFGALSRDSATRQVLSIFQHLKLTTTQDTTTAHSIQVTDSSGVGTFTVQVISSFDGLPNEIQEAATYQDEDGNTQNYVVSGVWHGDTLYLVADGIEGDSDKQITTFEAYQETIIHEVIGHFGVQQIFGKEYEAKFKQLFNALGGLDGIRKIAAENGVDMQQFENAYIEPYTQGAADGIYESSDVQQALVGELFAFVAQNAEKKPIVRQKLKEILGYIRQWLRDRGFMKLAQYNDADILMFIAEARKAVVDRTYFGKFKDKTISTNSSDKLFSRGQSVTRTNTTVRQVRDKLVARFGEATISNLEKDGKLNILDTYDEAGIEGFYQNGKATLIADALTDDTIVPTFLHELGGHGGFQNLMNQDQYKALMNQFNELVKRGNAIAVEAKELAERESNTSTQQLEMLPYLLTLSSRMQVDNVIQKGAIRSLVNKIISAVKAWAFDRLGVNLNLNPDDIVALAERMIRANAQFDSSQTKDALFSKQYDFNQILNSINTGIQNNTVTDLKKLASYKFTDWLGIGLSTLGRRQLTEIYSKLLPQLNRYNDLAAQMDAEKNDAGAEADQIVRDWAKLVDHNELAELMHDATLSKIDPAKPYVQGDSVSKYKQLRDAYRSLSPEAQSMYEQARDAYKKHYANVQQAIKERILRSELSSQKKADLLKQMDSQFYGYTKGVYFPLSRFGKYVVISRDRNGAVESVSRAETMAEAQALRSELMQKYPHLKVERVILDKEFNASRDAVGRGFMTSLFAEVDNLGLSTAEQAEFEDTLSQLYLSSLPDLSWAKHGIHRKGTAGFSQDARRAFAQNMFHGAGYLAKLRYSDQLAEQLDQMQKYTTEQVKTNKDFDQPTAQRVIDEMNKRHDLLMNPKSHPLSSALTSLGFIYYLGLSPASAMVNLMQTPLVAYPVLGSKWGYDKAGKALIKASEQAIKGKNDISKSLSVEEKKAYDRAVNSGVIDVTQAHDLAGIAQGEDSGIMWKTRPVMRWASFLFHQAERFNREVTFIAAYRLSRENGATHDLAYEQATDATYKGHFDYSSGNRPRLMQGNVAKVMLLFKQFGQNMVYLLARQAYQAIKAENPKDRAQARRLLAGVLTTHALAAGVLGLPMVTTLLAAASMIGGDDDEPWDAEVALRNFLADIFGSNISNMIMKGASRGMPWDISGRVGLNNLILPDIQEGLEGQRLSESAMAAALGPVASIGTNVLKGAQEISEGQFERGIETMLPTFLRSPLKALRFADEGVQDKTGISIQDEVATLGLIGQAMGFSPSDVRTNMEGKSAIYQLNKKLDTRREQLMAQWSRAKLINDTDRMDEVWEEIQQFNEKNPSRRINRINLNQSYKNRKNRIDKAEDGIYLSRNRQDAREAGHFAFGE